MKTSAIRELMGDVSAVFGGVVDTWFDGGLDPSRDGRLAEMLDVEIVAEVGESSGFVLAG